MSRLGISYEEVVNAANELIKKNENPTIDRIRSFLGDTGSFSTISKYLAAWRHGVEPNSMAAKNTPPDVVQNAVEKVWQQMREEADAEIEKIKDESTKLVDEMESKLRLSETNYETLKSDFTSIEQANHKLLAQKEITELDLKSLQEEYRLLQERHKSLEERYTDMHGLNTQHIQDLASAHKNEIIRLDERIKAQDLQSKKLIDEIKSANENERGKYMQEIDSLKVVIQKQEKIIEKMQESIRYNEILVTRMEGGYKSKVAECESLSKRLHEKEKNWQGLFFDNFQITNQIFSQINEIPKFDMFTGYLEGYLDNKFKNSLEDTVAEFKKFMKSSGLDKFKDE